MYVISREFEFCYGHRLWQYQGKCSNFHGHNAKVRITLRQAHLDDMGMVIDFSQIKNEVEQWIQTNWDHKTILCAEDPLLPLLRNQGVSCIEFESNPTAENFAKKIFELTDRLGLPVQSVEFWETSKCFAKYESDVQ